MIFILSGELAIPYHFATPAKETNDILAACFPTEGWVLGGSDPPNTTDSFSNGIGFVFAARPRGQGSGHAQFNDLNFEIWAYGANVTDGQGGSDFASKLSWSYNTIQINGLGQFEMQEGPMMPIHAAVLAFTNADDYVYCVGDATYAYPHNPLLYQDQPAGWLVPQNYASRVWNGELSSVTKVQRHILFMHHRYFIIYDDLAATNDTTFQWVYHVLPDAVTNFAGNGSFTYSVPTLNSRLIHPYPWTNVDISVYQVVSSDLLMATNLYGPLAYSNPLTGENYYDTAMDDLTNRTGNVLYTNSIWVSNVTPTTNFHFMTVIYPVKPGDPPPTIRRIDDYTVAVTNGLRTVGDVISFDPRTTHQATLIVNSPLMQSSTSPLPTPVPVDPVYVTDGTGGAPLKPNVPLKLRRLGPPAINILLSDQVFSPTPGYSAWWNPDSLSGVDYATVPSWIDSSSGRFTASQVALGCQPLLRVANQNSHNYVTFDGKDDYLSAIACPPIDQPLEIFCVARIQDASLNCVAVGNAAAEGLGVGLFHGQHYMAAGNGLVGGSGTNAWVQITAAFNGSSSQLFVNGAEVVPPGQNVGSDPLTGVNLGAFYALNQLCLFWNGDLGDVIIYPRILSAAERQATENALRSKFGF